MDRADSATRSRYRPRSHGFTGMFCPESSALCTRLPQLSSVRQPTYLPLSFPLSVGAWGQDLTKAPLNKKALLQHRAPSLGADPASQTAEQRAELDDFEKGQLLGDVSVQFAPFGTSGTSTARQRLSLCLALGLGIGSVLGPGLGFGFRVACRRQLHGVLIMDSALACSSFGRS